MENVIQFLPGKAALGHGDLVRPDPEAKTLLEEGRHHFQDFRFRLRRRRQNVNSKSLHTVEGDTGGSDGLRRSQKRLGLLSEYPARTSSSS